MNEVIVAYNYNWPDVKYSISIIYINLKLKSQV